MSYSSGGGGTVTLPSPTHIRHIDVSSAVRSLRRSITRSPSKFMDSPKSPPPFGTPTTASPSKLSDTPMGYSFQTPVQQPVHVPSPLAQPLVPSVKLSLRSAQRKNSVSSSTPAGKRTSPRSPLKRVLSESLSSANTQPRLGPTPSFVEEMGRANVVPWPATEPAYQKSQQNFMFGLDGADDSSSSPSPALFGATTPFRPAIARVDSQDHMTTSSLKRSDLMDTDQLVVDTPVAKRRSLHGSTVLGSEFNIFEHPQSNTSSPQFEIHEDPMNNIDMDKQTIDFLDSDPIFGADRPVPTFNAGGNGSATGATSVSQMPKRSSSLRKSTLSQRQDKKSGSWGRRHTHLASFENGNTPVKKDRPRASMGSLFEPPVDRGSPFAPGPLPNPSIHLFGKPQAQIATKQHPLSRSLVQSSSGNSLIEESNPPYAPALQPAKIEMEKPIISKPDFAKSMPIGAIRPKAVDNLLNQEAQFNGMATPDNFKVAKPLAGAFASTGLVSKVRMNADRMDPPTNPFKGSWRNKTMPDTPCKKTVSNNFHSLPAPSSGFAPSKIKGLRQSQSFYNSPKPDTPSDFTKSIFGVSQSSNFAISNFNSRIRSKDRKESFGSSIRDIDNFANSDIFESQSSSAGDNELPPTPTKGGYIDEFNDGGSPMRGNLFKLNGPKPRSSSKLNVTTTHSDVLSDKKKEEDSDSEFGCARVESPTPTSAHRFQSFHSAMPSTNTASSNLSFRRNRELKALAKYGKMSLGSPAPLSTQTKQLVSRRRLHSPSSPSPFIAKTPTLAGSPLFGDFQTPRTPQVDSLPDDTSRMSISGKGHLLSSRHARSTLNPPATPTTNNDAFASAGVTPVHGVKQIDIDEHLMQKFDKVEMIGQGEFSDVYRCTKQFNSFVGNQSFSFGTPGFGTPAAAKSPPSPDTSEQVYAIKKARGKFTGPKDRQNKMHEVGVLKALGKDEHIVTFIQNWEYDDILYIQMEFCEEGSLEGFLNYVGKKGRLDDFRIWKIMLELGLVSLFVRVSELLALTCI